jgi:hypothetical protein
MDIGNYEIIAISKKKKAKNFELKKWKKVMRCT